MNVAYASITEWQTEEQRADTDRILSTPPDVLVRQAEARAENAAARAAALAAGSAPLRPRLDVGSTRGVDDMVKMLQGVRR